MTLSPPHLHEMKVSRIHGLPVLFQVCLSPTAITWRSSARTRGMTLIVAICFIQALSSNATIIDMGSPCGMLVGLVYYWPKPRASVFRTLSPCRYLHYVVRILVGIPTASKMLSASGRSTWSKHLYMSAEPPLKGSSASLHHSVSTAVS